MSDPSKFGAAATPGTLPSEKLTKMLVAAVLRNDEGGIASLIKMGANPALSDIKGNTPVTIAATDPREHGALKSLLECGADPNVPSVNGRVPLHTVLRMKDDRMMEAAITLLLAGKADPNLVERIPAETPRAPLEVALEKSRSDKIIYLLLRGGADPCRGLNPALHQMAEAGRYALIQAAHAAGVNLDHADGQGMTPLMRASRAGAFRTLEVLLECGADPTLRDAAGKDVVAYLQALPPDGEAKQVVRVVMRASYDAVLRKEVIALRNELNALKMQLAAQGKAAS